jgi:peptidoglycan/LPS O-acetylase OafA/YrhL
MTENANSSDTSKPTLGEKGVRRRMVWLWSIVNLTLITVLIALWLQRTLTVQVIFILALPLLLVVNGAAWLGWRLQRRRTNRHQLPLICFAAAGLGGVDAVVEIASKDYASAGMLLTGSVGMILLGVSVIRRNAKKNDGGSEHL